MGSTTRITLYRPRPEDGIYRDISLGYYLKLAADDDLEIYGGFLDGIPQRWGLIAANIAIDTDVNVADRYLGVISYNKLRLGNGGILSKAFAANSGGSWDIGPAVYMKDSLPADSCYTGLNNDGMVIEGLQKHIVSLFSGQAGDKWHVSLTYKYLGESNNV